MQFRRRVATLALALAGAFPAVRAQQPTPPPAATATPDTTRKAQSPPAPPTPSVVLSGNVFGNYQYNSAEATHEVNQFVVDRAYVNARATLGQGFSARVTTDVFQLNPDNGWVVRLKYGFLQHDARRGEWIFTSRIGMEPTIIIEHVEQFWPRFLSPTPTDRYGYFFSADAGVGELVTLPSRWGEVYAIVVNGTGFPRRENDRFKDGAVRVTLTPLAGRVKGLLSSLTLTGWYYGGAVASRFVLGGVDQLGPVHSGLRHDRRGAFVGVRDTRVVAGFEYAARDDGVETGLNTVASPRVVDDIPGSLRSAFAVVRPVALAAHKPTSRFGLVGRWDDVAPGTNHLLADVGEHFHYLLAGALWEFSPRVAVALDYQETIARKNVQPDAKTYFAQFNLNF